MKWIKDRLLSWQLKRQLRTLDKKGIKVPEEFRCIGILANTEDEYLATEDVIREIWGYKVRIVGQFYSEEPSRRVEAISYKHFNLQGLPTYYCNAFLLEKLDFILIPSLSLNPYLRYLLLANQSGIHIGFYSPENKPYLDFMLDKQGDDLKTNIRQLLDYLDKIKEQC